MAKNYLPLAAANEFIRLAAPNGVSHMKLQKLVYLAHGLWLAEHDEPFLSRAPQVWQYGPVFEDLYHELKGFRRSPIKEPQALFDEPPFIDDAEVKATIAKTWERFKDWSAIQLSDLTHKVGSPWSNIAERHGFKVPLGTQIPASDIRDYVRLAF